MDKKQEEKLKKTIEKHLPKAVGEFTNNINFMVDVFSGVWEEARKDLIEEQIQTLKDLSKDSFEVYELKLLLEDYK